MFSLTFSLGFFSEIFCNQLGKLIILIDKGTISSSIGKKVLEELFENPRNPEEIIKEKGWIQISDEGAIKEVVLNLDDTNVAIMPFECNIEDIILKISGKILNYKNPIYYFY